MKNFDGLRFVVSRYKENIQWVPKLVSVFPGSKCTIYNKGNNDIKSTNFYDVVRLKNVGRESHTYLHHIIQEYDNLDDEVTVFLQGDPYDHCRGMTGLFDLIHCCVMKIIEGSLFENVGTQIIEIANGVPTFHMSIKNELAQTSIDLFGTGLPHKFRFSAGALFMTCRICISKRPIVFYENALKMLDSSINPIRGFCFERLWSLIFC